VAATVAADLEVAQALVPVQTLVLVSEMGLGEISVLETTAVMVLGLPTVLAVAVGLETAATATVRVALEIHLEGEDKAEVLGISTAKVTKLGPRMNRFRKLPKEQKRLMEMFRRNDIKQSQK